MVLFPEGGFLRKRKEVSQRYALPFLDLLTAAGFVSIATNNDVPMCFAFDVCRFAEKNNLPVLNNVTLPRVGAMKAIMDMLGAPNDMNVCSSSSTTTNPSLVGCGSVGGGQDAVKQSASNSTIISSKAINKDDDDCGK